MAAVFAVLISVNLIFSNFPICIGSTHWVVTEDGRIQAQVIFKKHNNTIGVIVV